MSSSLYNLVHERTWPRHINCCQGYNQTSRPFRFGCRTFYKVLFISSSLEDTISFRSKERKNCIFVLTKRVVNEHLLELVQFGSRALIVDDVRSILLAGDHLSLPNSSRYSCRMLQFISCFWNHTRSSS